MRLDNTRQVGSQGLMVVARMMIARAGVQLKVLLPELEHKTYVRLLSTNDCFQRAFIFDLGRSRHWIWEPVLPVASRTIE